MRNHRGNDGVRRRVAGLLAALALAVAGCDVADDDGFFEPGLDTGPPENVAAAYRWIVDHWQGVQPVGRPAVELTWELPDDWDDEPFRVYARQAAQGDYTLIATVTSCAQGACRYVDLNVAPGGAYDYFVATELRGGNEEPSTRVSVQVPSTGAPAPPAAPRAVALDNGVYLQWESTGAEYYRVFLERVGSDSVFYEIGQTDGTGYLDQRAENGTPYAYRVAAVDETGRVGARSPLATGTPRPDYHAELIYALADSASASGFRFPASQAENPLVAGTAAQAQWRLESVGGVLSIRPLGSTQLTAGEFTTALTCGPGDESDCISIDRAPEAGAFLAAPVPVETGHTYVFRVQGADGRTHYAKIRAQGTTRDGAGRTLMVFDWAYQLRPEVPELSVGVGG